MYLGETWKCAKTSKKNNTSHLMFQNQTFVKAQIFNSFLVYFPSLEGKM